MLFERRAAAGGDSDELRYGTERLLGKETLRLDEACIIFHLCINLSIHSTYIKASMYRYAPSGLKKESECLNKRMFSIRST